MRTGIDHLPVWKQRELREVVKTILDRFEEAHTRQATQWKKKGRILKVVLYGSHARGNWVFEPHTKRGYLSDFDLLIVSNHKRVVENSGFWTDLKEYFVREQGAGRIQTPVGMIVHTKQDAHSSLAMGRYFWIDIARDGIVLYDGDGDPLPVPRPKSPETMKRLATEYFSKFYSDANDFYDMYEFSLFKSKNIGNTAFQLHQAVEHLYRTAILVTTLYTPRAHNIRYLRHQAEKIDRRFVNIWPEDYRWQRVAFNRLKDAYVKGRYSNAFEMDEAHLIWLAEQAQQLSGVVRAVCDEQFTELAKLVVTAAPQSKEAHRSKTSPTSVDGFSS